VGLPSDSVLWTSLITITGVWLILVISPGPNFLATVQTALSHSRRSGIAVALGISLGTMIWSTASLLGLGLLFQTVGWLYMALKIVGGAYLVYLGIKAMITSRGAQDDGPSLATMTGLHAFRRGILVDLSNPKAAAFFISLFAVTVPPLAPLWFKALVVASVVAMAGGWYAVVACLVATGPVARLYRRARRTLTFLAGALFVALGVRLATDR